MAVIVQCRALALLLTIVLTATRGQEEGWGPWSAFSTCSRTCGVGVQQSSRECLVGRLGSIRCQGQSIQYRSCNTEECPPGSVDFRAYQCSSYNSAPIQIGYTRQTFTWTPYYDPSAPCVLLCRNENSNLKELSKSVIDGTSCDNGDRFGVCISGICKQVSCDYVIGSVKHEDQCLVCGGRGDTCDVVEGSTLDKELRTGEPTEVVTIPIGAVNLKIMLTSPSPSALELISDSGRTLKLTDAMISFGQRKLADYAGTLFNYHFMDDGMTFAARGPVNESLRLMVRFMGLSPLVKFSYSVHKSGLPTTDSPNTMYVWLHGSWTQCSEKCGNGYQLRAVSCAHREKGMASPDKCPQHLMPARNRTCNNGPCQQSLADGYRWVPGHWGECDVDCGLGEQTQLMHCLEQGLNGASAYARDNLCTRYVGPKPVYRRVCQGEDEDCPYWHTGEWSECSVTCGYGRQTRQVTCNHGPRDPHRRPSVVSENRCPSDSRPGAAQVCTRAACWDGSNSDVPQLDQEAMAIKEDCRKSRYGCCRDNVTSAKGDRYYGCNDDWMDQRDPCELPADAGTCHPNKVMWYYDTAQKECLRFWASACGGNRNRFETRDSCRDQCDKDKPAPVRLNHECSTSQYGCCADGVTHARTLTKEDCPERRRVGGCAGTQHGCCDDGITAAHGPNKKGCKATYVGGCAGTRYGCCLDGVSAAHGENRLGCPENPRMTCHSTTYGCCEDRVTYATGPNKEGCPEYRKPVQIGCAASRYGCCPDKITAKLGPNEEGCPAFDHASCGLGKDSGTFCEKYEKMWHFETKFGACLEFWYAGCGGNSNRFADKEKCEETCVNVKGPGVCKLPKVSGPCRASKRRLYFDSESGRCEEFIYGGCNGNNNNFETLEECQSRCNGAVATQGEVSNGNTYRGCASNPCMNGFECQDYSNGTYSCSCNPDWGTNCASPPDYWCFTDSECGHGLKCTRQRQCSGGYCWVYARCAAYSKRYTCDRPVCPTNQDCVNDPSFEGGYFCMDKVSYRRPYNIVLGCAKSEFGCCHDQRTAASGPNYEGCPPECQSSRYGCCKDNLTPAEGPNQEGCDIEGSGDVPCERTEFGCCDDGVTPAQGHRGEGCGVPPDLEANEVITSTRGFVSSVVIGGGFGPAAHSRQGRLKCQTQWTTERCQNYTVKWFYHKERDMCDRQWRGICQEVNDNMFETQEECEAECRSTETVNPTDGGDTDFVNICDMPRDPGPCRSAVSRYYYDPRDRSCRSFTFGGCQGNENNFLSLEECQRECMGRVIIGDVMTTTTARPEPVTLPVPTGPISLSMSGKPEVNEGEEIKVVCTASGPSQVQLEWFINGQPVTSETEGVYFKGRSSVTSNGFAQVAELIIPSARRENSGTYYCRSSSRGLEKMVITVNEVRTTPAPTTTEAAVDVESSITMSGEANVETGGTIKITCRAVGPRRPTKIEWFVNGHYVTDNSGPAITSTVDPAARHALISELIITDASTKNKGTYYCRSLPYSNLEQMDVKIVERLVMTTQATMSDDPRVACMMDQVAGNCYASIPRWFYDSQTGTCTEFIYGGCGGNSNNFESRDQCERFCSAQIVCTQPKELGPCRAAMPRYYFDYQTGSCSHFLYGGCAANLNNFGSMRACESKCAAYRRGGTGVEVEINGNGTEPEVDVCQLNPEKGGCQGYNIKWYYSSARNRCARFIYTGCNGNGNQFESEEECKARCLREDVIDNTRRPRPTPRPVPETTTTTTTTERSGSVCMMSRDRGNCADWVYIWYYDAESKSCSQFYYGGCGGNGNRFETKTDCENACMTKQVDQTTTQRPTPPPITERPVHCYYTTYGCCSDGITAALDRQKSNCQDSNIIVQPGTSGDHSMVLVRPGVDAFLECRLRGQEILWYRDGFLMTSSSRFQAYPNGTLALRQVTEDMSGDYTCRAANGNNIPQLEKFRLEVKVPLDLLPGPTLMSVKIGDNAFLHCQAMGNPQPRVSWSRNGRILYSDRHFSVFGNGTLIINNVGYTDAGDYECAAENGIAPAVRRTITLNIKEYIDADIQSHQGVFMEGDIIRLNCEGRGNPTPEIEWMKDGKVLETGDRVTVRGGELSISSATIEDAGMYRCVASNGRNQAEDITTLQIKFHNPLTRCVDSMRRTKCHLIVSGRLCGFRTFADKCCESCRRAGYL